MMAKANFASTLLNVLQNLSAQKRSTSKTSDDDHSDRESAAGLGAGTDPHRALDVTRLLSVEGRRIASGKVVDLPTILSPGDLVVLNDAGTLPASLAAHVETTGARLEVRLASSPGDAVDYPRRFDVVVLGHGDWRTDTDLRPAPPHLNPGDELVFDRVGPAPLRATVVALSPLSPRLVTLAFDRDRDALAEAFYAIGKPIQYAHLSRPLALADVQTPFATRAWAMEMPSTGRPLSWALLDALSAGGVQHAFLTHAAGLSATGDAALDAALPLPERFEIPAETVRLIRETKQRGGRVIAVGTTVVRALEAAALKGPLRAGFGIASLRIDAEHALKVVDGILTGIHSPGESHFELLAAFTTLKRLHRAHHRASDEGYLAHELGDLMLLMRAPSSAPTETHETSTLGGRLML